MSTGVGDGAGGGGGVQGSGGGRNTPPHGSPTPMDKATLKVHLPNGKFFTSILNKVLPKLIRRMLRWNWLNIGEKKGALFFRKKDSRLLWMVNQLSFVVKVVWFSGGFNVVKFGDAIDVRGIISLVTSRLSVGTRHYRNLYAMRLHHPGSGESYWLHQDTTMYQVFWHLPFRNKFSY